MVQFERQTLIKQNRDNNLILIFLYDNLKFSFLLRVHFQVLVVKNKNIDNY